MDNWEEMLKAKTWAVVGASDKPVKFGYKIFKFMVERGFDVYPVNPGLKEVYGKTCYASLADLPVTVDAVDVVVPPRLGEQVMKDCAALGIKNVWLQPGADAASVVKVAEELKLTVVKDCIMARA
jgi:predicted CoA-binding protein